MVKIKVVKKMNLAELLDYIIKNEVTDKYYFNSAGNACVEVTKNGFINFLNTFKADDTFELEFEEELTEETAIPVLLRISCEDDGKMSAFIWKEDCIANLYNSDSVAFHMVHPDGTTTLLWTAEGGIQ